MLIIVYKYGLRRGEGLRTETHRYLLQHECKAVFFMTIFLNQDKAQDKVVNSD
jgi:hypothetical protein